VVPDGAALVQLSDEQIIARLTQVRGIGRWTVEMLLMFQLRRPDVLPVDDFGSAPGFAPRMPARMPRPKALALWASAGSPSGRRPPGTVRALELKRAGTLPALRSASACRA